MTDAPTGPGPVLDLPDVPVDRADLVGGKAAGLALMLRLGLRVPPAFVITTDATRRVRSAGSIPPDLAMAVDAAVDRLERLTGRRLGHAARPLLLAVRSGAPVSMPGMMDTVLDVGRDAVGDARAQLLGAVIDVIGSWDSDRARVYREAHDIDGDLGTAVVVQAMVLGDLDPDSGSGVAFSRNPDTGAPGIIGDYLPEARGPDVVDGGHLTQRLGALAGRHPDLARELADGVAAIEHELRDLVDVEFTVEAGVLHYLQCRVAKRAAPAAVRIAVDLVDDGVIDEAEAVARVTSAQLDRAARPRIDASTAGDPLAVGTGACPGAVTGVVCVAAERVDAFGADGDPVVLVRPETSPDDLAGMLLADGLLTSRGGLVSHAALVARELDLPAVVGIEALVVDEEAGRARIGDVDLPEGTTITIDGSTGAVHAGVAPLIDPSQDERLARIRRWHEDLPAIG